MLHKLIAMRDRWREDSERLFQSLLDEDWGEAQRASNDADELDALIQEYEGWVCVPVVPTEPMIRAAERTWAHGGGGSDEDIYSAMIAAAEQKE